MAKVKKPKQIVIELLWGLPGSGKTYYTNKNTPEDFQSWYRGRVISSLDLDEIMSNTKKDSSKFLPLLVKRVESSIYTDTQRLILDGLITTNEFAKSIFDAITAGIGSNYEVRFHIVWWTPDRDACKHNDRNRRDVNSTATIENHPFEEPDPSRLGDYIKNATKQIERKKIVKKPISEIWASDLGFKESVLKSRRWSRGSVSCYDSSSVHSTPPDPQPEFIEFDELIEKLYPDIKFMEYKKIYRETVKVEESSESDYYGGHSDYGWYECDLKKLYSYLTKMEIVNFE